MKNKSLISLLALLIGFNVAGAYNAVKLVDSQNGEKIFLLSSHPKASLMENVLSLETDLESLNFDLGDGINFYFVDYEEAGIDVVATGTPVYKLTPGFIQAFNLKALAPVEVFDITGKTVKTGKTSGDGSLILETSDLPSGVYIFSSFDFNFKFHKK